MGFVAASLIDALNGVCDTICYFFPTDMHTTAAFMLRNQLLSEGI